MLGSHTIESIKDKVAIVGTGCSQFEELWDKDIDDLTIDDTEEALADARVDIKDIQAVCMGSMVWKTGGTIASIPKWDWPTIKGRAPEGSCALSVQLVSLRGE